MSMQGVIQAKLTEAFAPEQLEIIDDSESHRGHAGFREAGESHFNVRIRSAAFNGKSRVARQRMVYAVLKEEMVEKIHALALDVAGTY